jgi:hypothetical protein
VKYDWDKRLTGVDVFAAAELSTTIHKNGGKWEWASSVAHRGFGVAKEPHSACTQPFQALARARA